MQHAVIKLLVNTEEWSLVLGLGPTTRLGRPSHTGVGGHTEEFKLSELLDVLISGWLTS